MKKQLLLLLALLTVTVCAAQKKQALADPPKQLSLEEFIPIWFERSLPQKTDRYLQQTRKDDSFYYFSYAYYKSRFVYKINRQALEAIRFDSIDVAAIRKQFIEQMISTADKQEGNIKGKCTAASEAMDFSYQYTEATQALDIRVHWKVKCEFTTPLIDKHYHAVYHFDTGGFSTL